MGRLKRDPYQIKTIIEADQARKRYWQDVWQYRELLYVLSWRDLKVRYKQTVIGVLWAIIRPAITLLIFTVVFGKIAQLPSEGNTPYSIMVLAGLLPWQFFASAVSESSNSLIGNESLITKVYFPRVIIPVSTILTVFIDFLVSLMILGILMLFFRYPPSWQIIALPILLAQVSILSLGLGLALSAFNVQFRDFRYVIPFFLQAGLFLSPVGFSSGALPEKWHTIYALNPMVGIIDGFRWAITGRPFPLWSFFTSLLITIIVFSLGFRIFRRMERSFADHI